MAGKRAEVAVKRTVVFGEWPVVVGKWSGSGREAGGERELDAAKGFHFALVPEWPRDHLCHLS